VNPEAVISSKDSCAALDPRKRKDCENLLVDILEIGGFSLADLE
jgi:hypothetical protein